MIFDSIFHYSQRFLLLPPFPPTKNSVLISKDLTSVVKPQFLLNSPVPLALVDRQVGFHRLAAETGNNSTRTGGIFLCHALQPMLSWRRPHASHTWRKSSRFWSTYYVPYCAKHFTGITLFHPPRLPWQKHHCPENFLFYLEEHGFRPKTIWSQRSYEYMERNCNFKSNKISNKIQHFLKKSRNNFTSQSLQWSKLCCWI